MNRAFSLLAVLLVLYCVADIQSVTGSNQSGRHGKRNEIVKAIEAKLNLFVDAWARSNIKVTKMNYAKDLLYMANDAATIHSRKEVMDRQERLMGILDLELFDFEISVLSRKSAQSLMKIRLTDKDGNVAKFSRGLFVWKKIRNSWKVVTFIDNDYKKSDESL